MVSDRINRWLTLVANIGVLIGIFLLIVEIDQNNDLMQAQIEQSRSETLVDWRRQVVGDEGIAALLAKFEGDAAGLTPGASVFLEASMSTDGPSGRKAFKDETERILREPEGSTEP